jgi:hypothetical protein
MSDDVWRPFGVDDEQTAAKYDVLVRHVPEYLRPSLIDWVRAHVTHQDGLRSDQIGRLERLTRTEMRSGGRLDASAFFADLEDDARLLRITDALLTMLNERHAHMYVEPLEAMLREAGSAWTVGSRAGRRALVRRVDEATQAAVDTVTAGADSAAQLMKAAWGEAFGREPSASEAYRLAVKAIEAAAVPIVLPSDSLPTLGKVIAALAQRPDEFEVALPSHHKNDPHRTLTDMLGLAWHGQYDRHATGDPSHPLSVTQAEAEAVVLLAVTLVHWLKAGVLQRRSGKD